MRAQYLTGLGILVWATVICIVAIQVLAVPDEVFFSGDAGVKLLLVKQIARGVPGTPYLQLEVPPIVAAAWEGGMYPFQPPFVYPTPNGRLVSFPPAFQVLSAPFYAWFGFRGLYVMPALGVLVTLCSTQRTLAAIPVGSATRWGSMLALALATPMLLFAGVYWEHSFAVACACFGIDYLVRGRTRALARMEALALGLLSGLAFAFRSELLVFCASSVACILLSWRTFSRPLPHVMGIFIGVASISAINSAVYGSPLGAHSQQVVADGLSLDRVCDVANIARSIWRNIVVYIPPSLSLLAMPVVAMVDKRSGRSLATFVLLMAMVGFCALLPLVLPNSGGKEVAPRYALLVAPAGVVVGAELWSRIAVEQRHKWIRRALVGSAIGALIVGTILNTLLVAHRVRGDHRNRIFPALTLARSHSAHVVIATHTYVAQELGSLFDRKYFLLAGNSEQFEDAMEVARALGERSVLVVSLSRFDAQVVAGVPVDAPRSDSGDIDVVEVQMVEGH